MNSFSVRMNDDFNSVLFELTVITMATTFLCLLFSLLALQTHSVIVNSKVDRTIDLTSYITSISVDVVIKSSESYTLQKKVFCAFCVCFLASFLFGFIFFLSKKNPPCLCF